jgi:ATP-dependent DNA helicase RecG
VALREAMVNAVCHRDYLEQGAQVMVEIFDDRVEIYNPGGLPQGLSEKDFGRRSVCRNPNIAGLLLRCDYIEKMGTGIERIREALERERCPKINIRYDTMFTLEFQRPTYFKTDGIPESAKEKASVKTSVKILHLITTDPQITIPELAKEIGITTRSIERNIKNLQVQGRLRRIGPDKGGRWELTKKK